MRLLRIGLLVAFAAITLGALVLAQQPGDDASRATQYFNEINAAPYTDWPFEPNVPEGFYVGVEPHGMILRTFLNDIALEDTQGDESSFSEGAIIVKENHMPGETDISMMEAQAPVEGFDGNLAAVTFMVKVPGYNPEAGNWFWAKMAPDGAIDAAGKAQGCIACHSQAAERDYVFNVGPGGN
ncbi:MAG: cytochrome P460 family protein [Trueperaceae bacterium]